MFRNGFPLRTILLIATVLFVNLGVTGQVNESYLIGTWNVTSFLGSELNLDKQLILDSEKEALSSVYTFNKDKSSKPVSNYASLGQTGSWLLNDSTHQLTIEYDNSSPGTESYVVRKVDSDKMKWIQNLGDFGVLTMILTRNNL